MFTYATLFRVVFSCATLCTAVFSVGLVSPGQTSAGAEPAAEESVAPEPADSPSAARPFAELFDQWKDLLRQLRDLQEKYKTVQPSELEGIEAQFDRLFAQAESLIPSLRASAVTAYKQAPNNDPELSRFLISLTKDDLPTDNYESALELSRMLADAGSTEPELPDLQGRAAFATNDFEAAEKYLGAAKSAGTLSTAGEADLQNVGEGKKLWQQEKEIRKKEAAADDLPRVKLKTTKGDIVIELFENESPQTVGNLVNLVENGFYDGLAFHRVLPGFMAQVGCPKGDGTGGPGYDIYDECTKPNHRNHFRGSVSMAKGQEPNTGGSQFFLTFVPTLHLNGKHTVFGRVIEGLDVLSKLRRRDPQGQQAPADVQPDKVLSAEVLRKRDHEYLPTKVVR